MSHGLEKTNGHEYINHASFTGIEEIGIKLMIYIIEI